MKIGNSRLRSLAHSAVYLIAALYWAVPYAGAQGYPTKPVRLILSFAGGTDMVGRWLAQNLSGSLGQRVVPDPRVGAGGNIAHEATAKSPPDGYTLLMASSPIVVNPHMNPNVGYDPLRDFAPVALVASIPNVLVVHPSVPARTLGELVRIARSSPGKLTHGSGGIGSTNHLAAELLKLMAKIQIVHVPYKGSGDGIKDLLAGVVAMNFDTMPPVMEHIKGARLKGLAISTSRRLPQLSDVPTFDEEGIKNFEVLNWYGVMGPGTMPRELIGKLNTDINRVMRDPEIKARLEQVGTQLRETTPEEFAAFMRTELAKYGKLIQDANIKLQ